MNSSLSLFTLCLAPTVFIVATSAKYSSIKQDQRQYTVSTDFKQTTNKKTFRVNAYRPVFQMKYSSINRINTLQFLKCSVAVLIELILFSFIPTLLSSHSTQKAIRDS